MELFHVILHDPTGELMLHPANQHIPEFCDALETNLVKSKAINALETWKKKFAEIELLEYHRGVLFNSWKFLTKSVLFDVGASILQNKQLITDKMIAEWKVDVKKSHKILNERLKEVYVKSVKYLEKVKK